MEDGAAGQRSGKRGYAMGVRVAWLIWAVVWLGAGAGAAENAASVTRVGIALPIAGPIVLDGVLDEPSWAGAVEVSGFSVSGGEDLASQQTVLRVLYDATHLYVAIVCVEPAMGALRAAVAQRDGPFWEDDAVELFLDPAHAHDDYFQCALAAGGGCYDGHNGDRLWTSGWKAVARREAGAWTCEGSVPFADLKAAPPPAGALWGFNACRERRAGGTLELYNWADVQRVFSTPSLYGHLAFVERGWTASGEGVAAIARRAGGAQALVFVGDGYWTVKGAAVPQYSPYADDVAAALGEVPAKLAELATLTAAEASPLQRQRLAQLQQDHDGLRALLGGGAAVRAAAWAQALGTVQGLRLGVETLYWQVKLAALNRSMP